jgi:hypothetical protein
LPTAAGIGDTGGISGVVVVVVVVVVVLLLLPCS